MIRFRRSNACFASLVGVFEQERRGEGVSVDLSHVEGLLPLNAEALLNYTVNGRVQEPVGNRHPTLGAPTVVTRVRADDEWVMITIASDAEWQKFCHVLGNPAWSRNESFATAAGRKAAEDELDGHIAAWDQEPRAYRADGAVCSRPASRPVLSCRDRRS